MNPLDRHNNAEKMGGHGKDLGATCSSKCGLWASSISTPWSILKMQNSEPYPRPLSQNLHFNKMPRHLCAY